MPRKMTIEQAHEFLDSKPGWIALTTIGPDGYPSHGAVGVLPAGRRHPDGSQGQYPEAQEHSGEPQGISPLGERHDSMQDIKGLMVQGTATVHSSPEETLHYAREAAKLRGVPEEDLPTAPREGAAYIKVTPARYQVMGLLSRSGVYLGTVDELLQAEPGLIRPICRRAEMPRLDGKVALHQRWGQGAGRR